MITRDQLLDPDLPVHQRTLACKIFPQGFDPTEKNCLKLATRYYVGALKRVSCKRCYTCRYGGICCDMYYHFPELWCEGLKWQVWARKMLGPKGLHHWVRELPIIRSEHMTERRRISGNGYIQDFSEESLFANFKYLKRLQTLKTAYELNQAKLFSACMTKD